LNVVRLQFGPLVSGDQRTGKDRRKRLYIYVSIYLYMPKIAFMDVKQTLPVSFVYCAK
jgi:hypothetical protein